MSHKYYFIRLLITILLFAWYIPSLAQDSLANIQLGTIWFTGKSTKLTKDAKAALHSFSRQIKNNSIMQVQAVSFNKDFCDVCGARSLKRTMAVLTYLSKRGIPDNKLTLTNCLDGELNKVDLFLVPPIRDSFLIPHPALRKKKAAQE